MLGKQQIELRRARGFGDHALQKEGIKQVFEIAQGGITSHLPLVEQMQADAKFIFDDFRFGDLGTKDVHLVAAPDHFLDEINRFRRTAAGGRIERFVGQERHAQRRTRFGHAPTLGTFAAPLQSQFTGRDGEKF